MSALNEFYKQYPHYDVRANDGFLQSKAAELGGVTYNNLVRAAKYLESTLLLTPDAQSSWESSEEYLTGNRGLAYRAQFLEGYRVKAVRAAYEHEYNTLVASLGESHRGESIESLRNRAETKRRQGLSIPELREIAKKERPQEERRPFPGFPTLPPRMVPRGEILAVTVDATYLNNLAKTDFWAFKQLCKIYSAEQINARLRGEQ